MKQIDKFTYEVTKNEVVTMVFTPVGVGPFVELAVDGKALTKTGSNPKFQFPVTKPVDKTHFGHFVCDFPTGSEDDAKYSSKVSGSGSENFTGPTVFISDSNWERDMEWRVVEAASPAFGLAPGGATKAPARAAKKSGAKKGTSSSGKASKKAASKSPRKGAKKSSAGKSKKGARKGR